MKEQSKKIADLEDDLQRIDNCCDDAETENTNLRELHDDDVKKMKQLQSQLAQTKSERDRLLQNHPHGELCCQLERLQSELCIKNKKIAELDTVVSQSRSKLDRQKSHIADYKQEVEALLALKTELQDENTKLQQQLDHKTDSLTTEHASFEKQCCQKLRSAFETASAQLKTAEDKVADLQCELERAREQANGDQQMLAEQKKKIEDLEEERDRFDVWGDSLERDHMELLKVYDMQVAEIAELKSELEQSKSAYSILEAERNRLQNQNPSDSELRRQLQEKSMECVSLKDKLERQHDDHEDQLERYKKANAYLDEMRRKQQDTIRELRNDANVTYVPPQPRSAPPPAAAAAAEPALQPQPREETDYVSCWLIPQYSAEVRRLNRELKTKDREIEMLKQKNGEEIEMLKQKNGEYKALAVRYRSERDSLKPQPAADKVATTAVPLMSTQQQPAAAVTASEASSDVPLAETDENGAPNCRHQ